MRKANDIRWIWMAEGWLRSPALTDEILEKAGDIAKLEAELEARLLASPHADYLTARALVNELSASYEIEREPLDRTELYAAALEYFRLSAPSWADVEKKRRPRPPGCVPGWERRVIEAAGLLLEDDAMTPEGICFLHEAARKQGDGKVWGRFRPMQVGIYDGYGHLAYLAPPPLMVAPLMERFCQWWNGERGELPASVGSALAHLFFVVVHPFEDGNGRMTRLLAMRALYDKAGARPKPKPWAASPAILQNLWGYYDVLHRADLARGGDDYLPFVEFIQDAQLGGLNWSLHTLDQLERRQERRER